MKGSKKKKAMKTKKAVVRAKSAVKNKKTAAKAKPKTKSSAKSKISKTQKMDKAEPTDFKTFGKEPVEGNTRHVAENKSSKMKPVPKNMVIPHHPPGSRNH